VRPTQVTILYRRPPHGLEVYTQELLLDTDEVKVTLLRRHSGPTLRIGGRVALEEGAPALWFTFPGAWHDVGRFHRADGTVTGWYANICTPVEFRPDGWETTDLFLDLWWPPDGTPQVLDEDEFAHAVREGWISPPWAARAREEMDRLLREAREGRWPPAIASRFEIPTDAIP
jgi:predicted RNA-binding protein associated with RNAse of E/G family